MTWRPSARIVRLGGCATANLRGMALQPLLAWPGSNLNGGADYSVDFSSLLAPGDTIQSFSFDTGSFGTQAWTSLFGTVATAWIAWAQAGTQTVTVCILTGAGATFQVAVSIVIDPTPSLLPAVPPPSPGSQSAPVNDASMATWLASLPTAAPANGGWWSNAGIPAYQGAPSAS